MTNKKLKMLLKIFYLLELLWWQESKMEKPLLLNIFRLKIVNIKIKYDI